MPPITYQEVKELADALWPLLAEHNRRDISEQTREIKNDIERVTKTTAETQRILAERVVRLEKNQRKALVAWSAIVFAGTFIFTIVLDQIRAWFRRKSGM